MLHRILKPHASHVQPSVFITMLLFALFFGGTANGVENKAIAFDLPAQPMSASLDRIAESSRTKLIYADASVQGLEAPPLKGRYTVHQALDKVLNDQGLRYDVVDNTLIAVKPEESSKSTSLPKVTVSDTATYDSTDPYNPDYAVPNATTATKTDTPIMETPVSIQVVPKAVLQDRKLTRIQEALENVSGVRSDAHLDVGGRFTIRGFSNGGRIYRNGLGLIAGFGGFQNDFDTANLESIEVLKGSAAVLYGRIKPGGLINVNPRNPRNPRKAEPWTGSAGWKTAHDAECFRKRWCGGLGVGL